jgi:AraC-like DNA-binding protein
MRDRSNLVLDRSGGADPLADALSILGGGEARPSRLTAGGRWALRFGALRQAKVVHVLAGSCWLRVEDTQNGAAGTATVRLHAGDCYLLGTGSRYETASDPDLTPEDGRALFPPPPGGVAQYATGRASGRLTTLVGGTLSFADAAGTLFLDQLSTGVRVGAETHTGRALGSALRLLVEEAESVRPGGLVMRRNLTEILYLQVLRALLGESPARGTADPRWLGGVRDPRLGAALAAMHRRPDRPWTVAALAREAGMSRTGFATRFKAVVGLSPMDYLLRWRIGGAERDLAGGATVAAAASRWGYASESAFSVAFKRVTGRSPGQRRRPPGP